MFYSLPQLEKEGIGKISRLPVSIRIVLESVLRNFDGGKKISEANIRALAGWKAETERIEEADMAASIEVSPADGAAPTEGEAPAEPASAEPEDVQAEGVADTAETAEPVMIEVWHIGRRHHERRRRRHGRGHEGGYQK